MDGMFDDPGDLGFFDIKDEDVEVPLLEDSIFDEPLPDEEEY